MCSKRRSRLTSTLSVGRVADALISHAIAENPGIGISQSTVNPFVGECNDGFLNDIQGRHIVPIRCRSPRSHPRPAAQWTKGQLAPVPACHCLASRAALERRPARFPARWEDGPLERWSSRTSVNPRRWSSMASLSAGCSQKTLTPPSEKGSIVMVLATDAPLLDRQLKRLARRAVLGLARTGSLGGSGSGDVVVAFSTAQISQELPVAKRLGHASVDPRRKRTRRL